MGTILFIEDEPFQMMSFVEELRDAGHTVFETRTGEETLEFLAGGQHHLDLIILDIMLERGQPSDDAVFRVGADVNAGEMGVEILRQIREDLHMDVPIIVLTAVTDDDVRVRSQELGVVRYFVKPVSLGEFMEQVEEC